MDSRASISYEPPHVVKEVEGSIEVPIVALESIFELQELKNEFRFPGHTHMKGCSRE